MRDVVIVDAVRTPVGRRNGGLSTNHPVDTLGAARLAEDFAAEPSGHHPLVEPMPSVAERRIEGLPLAKRWYIVNTLAKTLSPAAEAFRYFMLEEAERYLAQEYGAPIAVDAREPA